MAFIDAEFNPIVEKFIISFDNLNEKEIKKEEFKIEITKIRFTKKDCEKLIAFFNKIGLIKIEGNKIIIK